MFDALRARLQHGPFSNGAFQTRGKLSRWTRVLVFTVPFILALNYLVIFQRTFFENIPDKLFSAASFHPKPFPTLHTNGAVDYWTWTTHTQFQEPQGGEKFNATQDACAGFPTQLLDRIQIILKTGAADGADRTNAQLSSVVKCIPNILIASDLSHPYGPDLNATDVLASLPPSTYLNPEDLEVYKTQKNASSPDDLHANAAGWKLDKYKFLAEVEHAVQVNPHAEWFVFFESDTYIFWDNLFRLLSNYDAHLPWYFGSPSPGRLIPGAEDKKMWFAYGGTGFVLSGAAAHRLVDRTRNGIGIKGPSLTDEYKDDVRGDCCGDSVLGWALWDRAGVNVCGLWPMFAPHALHSVPFSRLYWCEPVISLHKTHPEDFEGLWLWENSRSRNGEALLYRDLSQYLQLGELERREDWDNADWDGFHEEDVQHEANLSWDACKAYCHGHGDCFQFTWHTHRCYMSRAIRLGQKKEPDGEHGEEERRYIAGWDVEKIRLWREGNRCEEGAHWVKPSIERIF
jgi:hypothetical protein